MEQKKVFVTTRLEPEILEILTKVSSNRGESKASLVRRAILKELAHLKYLSRERRKALGLPELEVA